MNRLTEDLQHEEAKSGRTLHLDLLRTAERTADIGSKVEMCVVLTDL